MYCSIFYKLYVFAFNLIMMAYTPLESAFIMLLLCEESRFGILYTYTYSTVIKNRSIAFIQAVKCDFTRERNNYNHFVVVKKKLRMKGNVFPLNGYRCKGFFFGSNFRTAITLYSVRLWHGDVHQTFCFSGLFHTTID